MSAQQVGARKRALVVYESMFDNTATVATVLGQALESTGLETRVVEISQAPPVRDIDVDLLVMGAPTHAFTLPRASTRQDAVRQGARPERARTGVREWLAQARIEPPGRSLTTAEFDTRVTMVRHLPGSAARKASRLAHAAHLGPDLGSESFFVDDLKGPLSDGELERVRTWARRLATQVSTGPALQ